MWRNTISLDHISSAEDLENTVLDYLNQDTKWLSIYFSTWAKVNDLDALGICMWKNLSWDFLMSMPHNMWNPRKCILNGSPLKWQDLRKLVKEFLSKIVSVENLEVDKVAK